ncbi:MAG: hypothetical protein JW957_08850 [Candidatus Omnitrophica bacterium]|nr:hypothetical protein [Candidatus Omnitrophota bacterium]
MKKKYGFKCLLYIAALLTLGFSNILKAEVVVDDLLIRGGNIEDRTKYFKQDFRYGGTQEYPESADFMGRILKMRSSKLSLVFWCPGKSDAATGAWRGTIGMASPSRTNWDLNSFYNVIINGKTASGYPMTVDEAAGGEKGTLKISWHHPDALVTTEFNLLDGDDKLILTTTVLPKVKIPGYEVTLTAYPSSWAGGGEPGAAIRKREGLTAVRVLERTEKEDNRGSVTATLEKNEPWVLFYDKYFDVAENRGDGPCAALFSTKEASAASANVGNYACQLKISYPAEDKPVSSHMLIWDFKGMTNQAAIEYMKALEIQGD